MRSYELHVHEPRPNDSRIDPSQGLESKDSQLTSQHKTETGSGNPSRNEGSKQLVTDGGTDFVDPCSIGRRSPAHVDYINSKDDDDRQFVSDYSVLDSGWLLVRDWRNNTQLIPPHRVQSVQLVDVEHYGESGRNRPREKRVAQQYLREKARRIAQPTEAIVDGGDC